jgi:hypothetical protein
MIEKKLPSGAKLKIQVAPFSDAKALYQAVLKELKGVKFDTKTQIPNILKDLACASFSSEDVERALWKCFERCTYDSGKGEMRINQDTFEPTEARGDYIDVCTAVAKENILPFVKSLYAEFLTVLETIENVQP